MLWVNGRLIGKGTGVQDAEGYSILQLDQFENVFAVEGVNDGGPAGLIVMILLAFSDGTNATFVSDNTWKAIVGSPDGFQEPGFDDSKWPAATVLGPYGIPPWGDIEIPPA